MGEKQTDGECQTRYETPRVRERRKAERTILDKGIDHSLAATFGELQAGVGPVPLIEHKSHLSCNGAICRKA